MDQLQSTIESILFVASKPLSARSIAKVLEQETQAVEKALQEISKNRAESGIVLLESNGTWQFATNARNSTVIKNFLNADLREKLSDATIETLAIIAYRQPISRAEIEAIRGVNCQYSLRALSIRGLVQKTPNPKDFRQILYETTLEFLEHMGLKNNQELPDFEELVKKVSLPEIHETNLETQATD